MRRKGGFEVTLVCDWLREAGGLGWVVGAFVPGALGSVGGCLDPGLGAPRSATRGRGGGAPPGYQAENPRGGARALSQRRAALHLEDADGSACRQQG